MLATAAGTVAKLRRSVALRAYLPAQIADVTRHQDRRTLDGYIQAGHGAKHLAKVL